MWPTLKATSGSLVIVVIGALSGCHAPIRNDRPAVTAAVAPDAQQQLADAMKRSVLLGPVASASSSDGRITFRVPAGGALKLTNVGEAYVLTVPLGGSSMQPVSCTVWPSPLDTASTMSREMALTEKMTVHALNDIDAGVFGPYPYLYTETVYRTEKDGAPVVGVLKAYVVNMDEVGFACVHDEVGYRQALEAVAQSLATSLAVKGVVRFASRFREVHITSLNGNRVGFSEMRVVDRNGGGTVSFSFSALLTPHSTTAVDVEDSATVEVTNSAGRLVTGRYVAIDRTKVHDLTLVRKETGLTVDGSYHGKSLHAEFPDQDVVDGAHRPGILRTKLLARGSDGPTTLDSYLPSINPLALTPIVVRRLPQPGSFAFAERVGALEMFENLDDTGSVPEAELNVAGSKFSFKRVLIEGSLP